MAIEAFHRYLKVVYLEGKHNRRIDSLLSTLLRIAWDRVYDQAVKLEKGKNTHRIREINKRDHAAEEMMRKLIFVTKIGGKFHQLLRKTCTI
jgi:tellurite resistance protein